MTSDDKLAAALRQLRRDYLAESPRRLAELWTAYARVQNGEAAALAELRVLAHRLAGTGGGYGLPLVTDRARAADQRCRALIDAGTPPAPDELLELQSLVQGIADAFQDVTSLE